MPLYPEKTNGPSPSASLTCPLKQGLQEKAEGQSGNTTYNLSKLRLLPGLLVCLLVSFLPSYLPSPLLKKHLSTMCLLLGMGYSSKYSGHGTCPHSAKTVMEKLHCFDRGSSEPVGTYSKGNCAHIWRTSSTSLNMFLICPTEVPPDTSIKVLCEAWRRPSERR